MSITRRLTVQLAPSPSAPSSPPRPPSRRPRTSWCRPTKCSGDLLRRSCRPGAQIAVLEGNPAEKGPITLRLKFPANYNIPAHWHSMTERLTVLSGLVPRRHGRQARPQGEPDARTWRLCDAAGQHAPLRLDERHRRSCKSISKDRSTSST